MIYIILFIISLLSLVVLVFIGTRKYSEQSDTSSALQMQSEWFRIDLVRAEAQLDHAVRSQTRQYMRTFLQKALSVYQYIVHHARKTMRKRIQKTLSHYHEKRDPVAPRTQSRFLSDINAHKQHIKESEQNNGIHEEFPDEEEFEQ